MSAVEKSRQARLQIPLQYQYEPNETPLTTEGVWKWDPEERNPHRKWWVLGRSVKFLGLEVNQTENQKGFRVSAAAMDAKTQLLIRPKGPWFQELDQFPCTEHPLSDFATVGGSIEVAQKSSELWEKTLTDRRNLLEHQLSQIATDSAESATLLAHQTFDHWLKESEELWRQKSSSQRAHEWVFYWKEANKFKVCGKGKKNPSTLAQEPPAPDSWMEPPSGNVPMHPLARTPARRWDGLYVIHAEVQMLKKRIVGQFLIDPSSEFSLVSPSFLRKQVITIDEESKKKESDRIVSSVIQRVRWFGGTLPARFIEVAGVQIGTLLLPMKTLGVVPTEIFKPPMNIATCCDGVLGKDFLFQYAVEFDPQFPAHLKIWPREGFQKNPQQYDWIEISEDNDGKWVSDCSLESPRRFIPLKVDWRVSTPGWILIPPASLGTRDEVKNSALWCSDRNLGKFWKVQAWREAASVRRKFTGPRRPMQAGVEFLSRGKFVFDLGHGRLWLERQGIQQEKAEASWGLKTRFELDEEEERILRVQHIVPNSPASRLQKMGLKPGDILLTLNETATDELDQWEVDRILNPVYPVSGAEHLPRKIELSWRSQKGSKKNPQKAVLEEKSEPNHAE